MTNANGNLTPRLEYVESGKTNVDEITDLLIHNGGVVIQGLVDPQVLNQINEVMVPLLEQSQESSVTGIPNIVGGLVERSPTFANEILLHPLYSGVSKKLLGSTVSYYRGDSQYTLTSEPQLNGSGAFLTAPGNAKQALHRDDYIFQNDVPTISPAEYKPDRDTMVLVFAPGSRSTKANGATRFVPGSHLLASTEWVDDNLAVYAEMEPGDIFIMLGSVRHGASPNTTENEKRLMYSASMTKGHFKTAENYQLAWDIDSVRKFSPELQKITGYRIGDAYLGYVALQRPEDRFRLDEAEA